MNSIEQDEAIRKLDERLTAFMLKMGFELGGLMERLDRLEARMDRAEPPWAGLMTKLEEQA